MFRSVKEEISNSAVRLPSAISKDTSIIVCCFVLHNVAKHLQDVRNEEGVSIDTHGHAPIDEGELPQRDCQ
jgi:hypothetical protein